MPRRRRNSKSNEAGGRNPPCSYVLASPRACFYAPCVAFRSSPRKVIDDSDLYAIALSALMRRAYSIHEMKEYLKRRAEDETGVAVVIARLRELNYLDDGKYARDYARLHTTSRRQGKFRIARELRGRGVPDEHIDAALESVFAETDESALARERIKRKLDSIRGRSGGAIEQKKIASLYRSLLAAGFSGEIIRSEIRKATKVDAGETVAEEIEGA
jgi:regulatory protein